MARTSKLHGATTHVSSAVRVTASESKIAYFTRLLKLPLVERHETLAKGAPVKAVVTLFKSYSFIDKKLLLKVVGVSQRTLERRGRTKDLLSSEVSDRVMRLSEVTELATRVLGGRDLAEEWLSSPATAFRRRPPLDLITTTGGYEAVKLLLNQIDHGVYV